MRRWIREGRGSGHGTEYRPWLQVQDVLSIGHAHKVSGLKIRRTHHVFSDLEASCLTLLEFEREVLDIREQFPLLPTDLTKRAAKMLHLRHPVYLGTRSLQVMTTDFCVDTKANGQPNGEIAIAVKYSQDLCDPRTRELLSIEREANIEVGRRWVLFTEATVAPVVVRNLTWLRRHALPLDNINPIALLDFCRTFRHYIRPRDSLGRILTLVKRDLRMSTAAALEFFAIAGWYQRLAFRLDVEISMRNPIALSERFPDLLHLHRGE